MEKTKELRPISPFEFVIMSYADPDEAKKHRPYTKNEILNQRKQNIKTQLNNLKK